MADIAESELVELIAREQRTFRRILLAGSLAIFLVAAFSVAVGSYYISVSKKLTARAAGLEETSAMLEAHAFQTRRTVELQADRLARQQIEIGRAYEEIRALLPAGTEAPGDAVQAAISYLETGAQSLAGDRLIERASALRRPAAEAGFLRGVNALIAWDRDINLFGEEAAALGENRDIAMAAFTAIAGDERFARYAHLGLSAGYYRIAQAGGFMRTDCEMLFDALAKLGTGGDLAPQALYWTATCERKLGRPADAVSHYALALNLSRTAQQAEGQTGQQTRAERTLEMNAFHGLGTVLVASMDVEGNATVDAARELAAEVCPPLRMPGLTPVSELAYSCISEAIRIRGGELGQTRREVDSSSENLSFVYLKNDQFEIAFAHAQEIETETGLFAWNELIRALSAAHTGNTDAEEEARKNVALFATSDFNLCEIRVLLDEDLYAEALIIVLTGREAEKPDCNRDI